MLLLHCIDFYYYMSLTEYTGKAVFSVFAAVFETVISFVLAGFNMALFRGASFIFLYFFFVGHFKYFFIYISGLSSTTFFSSGLAVVFNNRCLHKRHLPNHSRIHIWQFLRRFTSIYLYCAFSIKFKTKNSRSRGGPCLFCAGHCCDKYFLFFSFFLSF